DPGDSDEGGNTKLNKPGVLSAIVDDQGTATIQVVLRNVTLGEHKIGVYEEDQAALVMKPVAYLPRTLVLGNPLSLTLFGALHPGKTLHLTLTDPSGNTSEMGGFALIQGSMDTDLDTMSDAVENQAPGGSGSIHSVSAGARSNLQLQGGTRAVPGEPQSSVGRMVLDEPPTSPTSVALAQRDVSPYLQKALATGDGNGDGILDSQQLNVVSFPGVGGKWTTLASRAGTSFKEVSPSGPPDFANLPAGYTFPLGFVNFTVTGLTPGGSVVVTNFFHDEIDYDTVFAYGPTPDNTSPHWYEFQFNGSVGAKLDVKGFTLTFVDGGVGDHDLKADGQITTTLAAALRIPPGPPLTLLSTAAGSALRVSFNPTPSGDFVLATNEVPIVTSVLAWPASVTNYFLEFTDAVSPTNFWQPTFDTPTVLNDLNVQTNTVADTTRFYRLRRY
ncbi:MAG: choice-of-anchor U domain-containing protein, partial [Verrucomicrobiota bacterium]